VETTGPAILPPPSRAKRTPVALAAGLVMALGLGWVAVRAVGKDPETRRSAAATTLAAEPRAEVAKPDAPTAAATPPPAVLSPASAAVTLPPAPRVQAAAPPVTSPTPAAARPSAAPTTSPARPRAETAPPAPEAPERVVVHPEVGTAIPSTGGEDERLERARRMALELAQSRREALARRVQRLQDQLAVIEDPDAVSDMQARLDEALQQLDAADREVARLRGEESQ
jgi:hypothetical protein